MKFKVEPEIFQKFPGVRIGVLVVLGMDNSKGGKAIEKLLREEEKIQNTKLANSDFNVIPETAGWKEIYRRFGSNPRDFRSSVESLLRRARTGNPLPLINPLVDLYNYLSIKHYLPAGAEDLDKIVGDISLKFAEGTEKGKYIGSDEVLVCDKGEVIYADEKGFICRKWNWREGDRTKIEVDTKNVALVFEALPDVSDERFITAMNEAEKLILGNLGNEGDIKILTKILSRKENSFEIDFITGTKAKKVDTDDEITPKNPKLPKIPKAKSSDAPFSNLIDKFGLSYQLAESLAKVINQSLNISLKPEEITLDHPKNPSFGDYSTNVAMIIGKTINGQKNMLDNLEWLVKKIDKNNFEDYPEAVPVGSLSAEVQKTILATTNLVYLKPRVYAKICGWWKKFPGHPELLSVLGYLPLICYQPNCVLQDKNNNNYLFAFEIKHFGVLIIEVDREKERNEIVTGFFLEEGRLKSYKKVWEEKESSLEGRRISPLLATRFNIKRAGAGLSSLQESRLYYKKLDKESQAKLLIYEEKLNPSQISVRLIREWQKDLPKEVEKLETVDGFLNIWLNNGYLISYLDEVLTSNNDYGKNNVLKGKKILLEHTSPNPQTTIMLGHLRNNFLGMTSANLLKNAGAKVKLDCIVNDRGVHICRSMWGYLVFANKDCGLTKKELIDFKQVSLIRSHLACLQGETLQVGLWRKMISQWINNPNDWWTPEELGLKPDHANLTWYVLGSQAYKEIEGVEAQVHEILREWEVNEPSVRKLWKTIIGWSEEGYAETYKKIGSHHDKYWYESDHWQEGKDIVENGLQHGVFKLGDIDSKNGKQPIVTDLSKDGLTDTVVIKSDGTGLYMTQDLALTRLKIKAFPSDLYIWDIGAEQTIYFQQLFTVIDKLGIAKRGQLFHLAYALINFKGGGKMSTRSGNVVMADETLDLLKQRTLEIIAGSNQVNRGDLTKKELDKLVETIAVGAVKYALLKYGRETTMQFDIDESLSLTGNSGPYLQYTYSRCQSVIRKACGISANLTNWTNLTNTYNTEELTLLRTIYQFPEVVLQATKELAPNLICNYLFDLAQKFNVFYDKHRILRTSDQLSVISDQGAVIGNQRTVIGGREKTNSPQTTDHQSLVTDNQQAIRLALTSAVGQVIKNGLNLLGIESPERM